jgi:hypothetical protein
MVQIMGNASTLGAIRLAIGAAASGMLMVAALIIPGAALAASNHSISGETWSSASVWYTSATVRTKSGDGNPTLKFTSLPRFSSGNNDCIKWRYVDASDGSYPGTDTMCSTGTSYSYWYMWNGDQFKNSFARETTCFSGCSHTFAGTQYY